MTRLLALLFVGASVGQCLAASTKPEFPDERFNFALIGDTPYDALQETNLFPNMMADLDRARVKFVVHVGDFKPGAAPCTDELFQRRVREFGASEHPFVFLFGDNEWSDCGKVKTNAFDPGERLNKLRELFCQGDLALGREAMKLTRQSENPDFAIFRENVRWVRGRVVFAGLNVPGADNHYGTPEFGPRNTANIAWIEEAFALAKREQSRAVMILMQANPNFDKPSTNSLRVGFNAMLAALERETVAFGKPVVLVHGDSHYFRIDQPLMGSKSHRRVENFTRVETFGNPDVHWIDVRVDWRDPNVFTFRPRYVEKNLVKHVK
jgi:hypothetical protein